MGAERVVIIGGGVAGLALADALAQAGAGERVTLLEAEAGFGQHSSGRNAAILRTAIEAAATRRLALASARRLRHPRPGFSPVPLLEPIGVLVAEGNGTDSPPGWVEDHVRAGEAVPLADPRSIAPHWRPRGTRVWHLPRQGRLDVAALLAGLAAGARAGGVALRTGARVTGFTRDGARLRGVRLGGGGELKADVVVLAAGGWVARLAREVGALPDVRITRRHLLVTGLDARVDPRWPVVWDDAAGLYARPESGGLLVCACDVDDIDPDRLVPDPDVKLAVARKVGAHLPGFADAAAAHFWPGLRTLTPDDTPLVGPDTRCPGLFWLAGLGGHGMTLSLSIGELAADLLLDRPVDDELRAAVDPARFLGASHV